MIKLCSICKVRPRAVVKSSGAVRSHCAECVRAYQAKYQANLTPERKAEVLASKAKYRANLTPEQKSEVLASQAKYRASLAPEQKAEVLASQAKYRASLTPDQKARLFENSLKRTYGITSDDYARFFEKQGGCCPVCGDGLDLDATRGSERVCVEHNHETGRVRGLLHAICNILVGMSYENPERLHRAALWIEHQHKLDGAHL